MFVKESFDMKVYDSVVAWLRGRVWGRLVIDVLWPIKRSLDFFFTWVLSGRKRVIDMRSVPSYRQGLMDLLNSLPTQDEGLVMVEVGSYRGESAALFLSTGKVSHIYCVDPWKPFYDISDAAAYTNMAKVEQMFDARFADEDRVTKVKGTIDDFVSLMACSNDGFHVDLVYIDGCHTEVATNHDITVSMDRIRPRVAIAGHDYVGFSGVQRAVDGRFGKPDKVFSDTSWLKILKAV